MISSLKNKGGNHRNYSADKYDGIKRYTTHQQVRGCQKRCRIDRSETKLEHVLRDAHTAGERQHVDRSRDQGLQEDNGPKTGSRKTERLIDAPGNTEVEQSLNDRDHHYIAQHLPMTRYRICRVLIVLHETDQFRFRRLIISYQMDLLQEAKSELQDLTCPADAE